MLEESTGKLQHHILIHQQQHLRDQLQQELAHEALHNYMKEVQNMKQQLDQWVSVCDALPPSVPVEDEKDISSYLEDYARVWEQVQPSAFTSFLFSAWFLAVCEFALLSALHLLFTRCF